MIAKFNSGSAIKEARNKAGFSQRKLAEKTGISESEISSYENNRRRPGIEKYAALARALNISIDELYYGDTATSFTQNVSSEGEIIAQCIRRLWEKGVVSIDPITVEDESGYEFTVTAINSITLHKYPKEIISLLDKLKTYADDRKQLSDPESFVNQIVQIGANAIDERAYGESHGYFIEDEDIPF